MKIPRLCRNPTFSTLFVVHNNPKKLFVVPLQKSGEKIAHLFVAVQGGFRRLVEKVADELELDYQHIFANDLLFHSNGSYMGYDTTQPTSRTGGKREVIQTLKERVGHKR